MAITNLLPFLQSAAGTLFDDEMPQSRFPSDTPGYGDDIQVTGRSPQVFEDDPIPMNMGNVSSLLESQAALENAPERKGMFGIKGTLRDVLGTLGDAFLVQSGGKEGYAPRRQQERTSDALGGFTQNPLAAIERLSQVNPEAAQNLFKQFQLNQSKQATEARQVAELERKEKMAQDNLKYRKIQTGRAMLAAAKTPEDKQEVLEWLSNPNLDMDNLPAHLIEGSGINPYQRAQLGQGAERIEVSRQNANANTTRAGRAPQGRATPEADIVQGFLDKEEAGGTLTSGEKARVKKFTQGTGNRSRGSGRTPASSSSGTPGKLVIRNGKLVQQ